ncbi:Phosphotransferase enzyme family protein [Polystyrenella longa]|uniref:Phosphotransferase enzyme family protein n=1 Tax=Polystyrenella longa TaxID=2528007 RepID=A0A518CMC4_9PLAN|nr:aminoglycoside phosphotransferase family protein [Polystyrenella longa]QDU80375.1 Phosphotransferase enzyme family protein [Polystyrenella longa]
MRRLPGVIAHDFDVNPTESSVHLAEQLGKLATQLHRIQTPGFGTWIRDPGISLLDEHRRRRNWLITLTRQSRCLHASLLRQIEVKFMELEEALESAPSSPVLVHRDFQPRNILVDSECQITGLVDCESAGGGDPLEDFNRIGLNWESRAFAVFCQSYRQSGGDWGNEANKRFAYYVLFWATNIIGKVGETHPELLPQAETAVERILAEELPDCLV